MSFCPVLLFSFSPFLLLFSYFRANGQRPSKSKRVAAGKKPTKDRNNRNSSNDGNLAICGRDEIGKICNKKWRCAVAQSVQGRPCFLDPFLTALPAWNGPELRTTRFFQRFCHPSISPRLLQRRCLCVGKPFSVTHLSVDSSFAFLLPFLFYLSFLSLLCFRHDFFPLLRPPK